MKHGNAIITERIPIALGGCVREIVLPLGVLFSAVIISLLQQSSTKTNSSSLTIVCVIIVDIVNDVCPGNAVGSNIRYFGVQLGKSTTRLLENGIS